LALFKIKKRGIQELIKLLYKKIIFVYELLIQSRDKTESLLFSHPKKTVDNF